MLSPGWGTRGNDRLVAGRASNYCWQWLPKIVARFSCLGEQAIPPPASVFAFVRRNCPLFACMDDPFSIVIVVSLQENVMKWFEGVWGMPSDQLQKGLVTNCSLNSFASIYTYTVAQEFIWLAFLPTTLCLHLFVLLCFCQVLPPCLFVRIWPEMSLLARPYPGCVFSLFLRELVLKTVFIFFRYLMPEPLLIGGLQVEIMFL